MMARGLKARGLKIMSGAAVLAVGLSACGATVPTTHVGAPASGSAFKSKAGSVQAISMADVKRAVSADRSVSVHTTMTMELPGASASTMETTVTTDVANHRFAFTSSPVTIPADSSSDSGSSSPKSPVTVPGYEVRGQTGTDHIDLYLRKAGDPTWTHLVVDKSLGGEVTKFSDPSQHVGELVPSDIPGITLKPEDTVTYKGETMSRQVATIDLAKMIDGIIPKSKTLAPSKPGGTTDPLDELQGAMGEMLSSSGPMADMLPKGTIEVLVDHDEFPRRITTDLSAGGTKAPLSTRSETTIDPLDDTATIDMPSPDQVGRTVKVKSADDLAAVFDALEPLGNGIFGGN